MYSSLNHRSTKRPSFSAYLFYKKVNETILYVSTYFLLILMCRLFSPTVANTAF